MKKVTYIGRTSQKVLLCFQPGDRLTRSEVYERFWRRYPSIITPESSLTVRLFVIFRQLTTERRLRHKSIAERVRTLLARGYLSESTEVRMDGPVTLYSLTKAGLAKIGKDR